MDLARTIDETRSRIAEARCRGAVVGFVPTMGFLHEGHLSLIDAAREAGATFIVVSVFVNPKQFGPNEDFATYPRDEARDDELLRARDVDLVFLPGIETMYPPGSRTMIHIGGVSGPLEGARRPGHFDGVATVVAKLFNIVQPDLAVFGRKDAQQCAVIARLVRDLDIPLRLVFGETKREPDGLAMSSRNSYLTPQEREIAPILHRALRAGEEALLHDVEDVAAIEKLMHRVFEGVDEARVDYLALVDPETFEAPEDFDRDLLVAGAIQIGKTHLIDNIRIPREAIPHTKVRRSS